MKRRDVLKLGAVAAAATQLPLGAGCLVPPAAATPPAPAAAQPVEFLALLDRQLAGMEGADFVSRFIRAEAKADPTGAQQAMLDDKDAMFRRMLRTLIITQGFRDQEPATQLDPAVQARMFAHLDEVGATVFEVSDLLASLDDRHHAKLKQTLKDRPDLPMAIAEAIDGQASQAGISATRRLQLRQMMANATFRLRHGDPKSLIGEYVDKVERVRDSNNTDARALELSQKMGERAFWKYQHLAQDAGGQVGGMPPVAQPQPPPGAPPPQGPGAQPMYPPPMAQPVPFAAPPTPPPAEHPGSKVLRASAYLMGIGVVTGGISIALVDAADGFLIGVTVGALLFAIGFVALIVGAIIYASA